MCAQLSTTKDLRIGNIISEIQNFTNSTSSDGVVCMDGMKQAMEGEHYPISSSRQESSNHKHRDAIF